MKNNEFPIHERLHPEPKKIFPFEHEIRLALWRLLKRNRNRYNYVKSLRRKFFGYHDFYFLLSFPKCGRTWLRYMIDQSESAAYGIPLRNTAADVWYGKLSLPRVTPQHGFKYYQPFSTKTCYNFSDHPPHWRGLIFLVRDPFRVMISWYNQAIYREKLTVCNFYDFLRHPQLGIGLYVQYVSYYLQEIQNINHIILTYEELQKDTFSSLRNVLHFINLQIDDDNIHRIVNNSSFEKMKNLQSSAQAPAYLGGGDKSNNNSQKVRTGGKDNIYDYFSEPDMNYMHNSIKSVQLFRELGYT